jgi:hypothetical protein
MTIKASEAVFVSSTYMRHEYYLSREFIDKLILEAAYLGQHRYIEIYQLDQTHTKEQWSAIEKSLIEDGFKVSYSKHPVSQMDMCVVSWA